ncbi:DNA polymerase III subunit beta [Candidatus Peregrinibacteria bacterium]|nr:DNA polymerase III subunit beta [Candidatus Peregrinibacteria bacterium]MBI3816320.1 DNA polymerase III subunit beta [Candidatus Peregrinibacteria bacterium]
MKFSCSTVDFLQALQLVARAIGGQQALPILGNILIEVHENHCRVSATDLELSIITTIPAKVEREGAVTLPAKAILNFAQYNNDPEVLLETNEGTHVRCTSLHTKTMISGEAASEYPVITQMETQTTFTLTTEPLLQALHLVTFASARAMLRPVLSGVSLRRERGKLILVATDSYRLSEYALTVQGAPEEISCIIPAKILEELIIILAGRKPERGMEKKSEKEHVQEDAMRVEVAFSKQQIGLTIGSTHLLSRLIDGKFPDYQQIIPKEPVTKVLFPAADLTTAVKRMHYFAKEMNNNLTFHCAKDETRIMTPQTQIGRDEAIISTEAAGPENKIALSSSFLLDFLGHIHDDVLEMHITDSMHPAVFRLPSEPTFLHLIMPLRMQEE